MERAASCAGRPPVWLLLKNLMIADGAPLVVVSKQLGHAQTSTTANIYAHAIASAQAKAMQTFDRFNDMVAGAEPEENAQEGGNKKAAGE